MNRLFIRSWAVALLALLALAVFPRISSAQQNAPIYQAPLAYINMNGNVYVVPSGSSVATTLTQDGNANGIHNTPPAHIYNYPRWSPDGSKLAFEDMVTGTLYAAPLGASPKAVATGIATEYPPAWQADNNAIAYVQNTHQPANSSDVTMAIQQVNSDGSQGKTLATFIETVGCGGGTSDPAATLYNLETGFGGNGLTFARTPNGWLYSPSCSGVGLAFLNMSNQVQWKVDGLGRAAVSLSGAKVAAVQFDQQGKPASPGIVDLTNGNFAAINGAPAVDQVAWSADETTVLFSTTDGQKVTLWKIPAQGGLATSIFSDQGRYIGAIASSPDSQSALFSFIPGGDNPQMLLLSAPMTGPIYNLASVVALVQGGRPAFASGGTSATVTLSVTLEAVSPTATPTAAAACVPRTDWPTTYTVVAGDTLFSIAQRSGTTVDVLAAGNCLSNANAIFAGQVLHVPGNVPPIVPIPGATRIRFPAGATTVAVQGALAANASNRWVLRVLGGQTLSAQLAMSVGQGLLVVFGADGTVLQSALAGASGFNGVVPTTQDYFLDVRATPNTAVTYTLTITIPPLGASTTPVARRITFPAGATTVTVQGQLVANSTDRWVLRVLAGQTLTAQVGVSTGQAILIVFGADGTVLQTDHAGASSFSGPVPSTQDYILDVRSVFGATLNYTLTITIPPLP